MSTFEEFGMEVPKIKIGDKFWIVEQIREQIDLDCPDCKGTKNGS